MTELIAEKICILIHDFGAGGTERIAIRLANHWVREGRQVSILCGSILGPQRALVEPQVSVLELKPAIVRGLGSRRRLGLRLASVIDDIDPSMLFIPGNFHFPLIVPLRSRLRRSNPRIAVKLSNPIRRPSRSSLAQSLFESALRRTLMHVDAIVAMALILGSEARLTLQHPNIVTIAEPILSIPQSPVPRTDSATIELIAAGRLVPQKNFCLAIEALAMITDPRVRLTIYGDGPERAALQSLACRRGIAERVSMPGYVSNLGDALLRSHLFLLPSAFEGYPAVVIEAFAARVPVIATDCSPAIRDVICDPDLGAVIDAPTPALMAQAIRQSLHRAEPAAAIWEKATAGHYIGPIAKQYLQMFDRTMNAPSRP